MVQLVEQQVAMLFGALESGDVAKHDAHAVAERKKPIGKPAAGKDDRRVSDLTVSRAAIVFSNRRPRSVSRAPGRSSHSPRPSATSGPKPK